MSLESEEILVCRFGARTYMKLSRETIPAYFTANVTDEYSGHMTTPFLMGVANNSACNLMSEAVRKFGLVRLRVAGASMVPTMRPGDLVTVERAGVEEISPGEIVVFARDGRLVVHRVTAKFDSKFNTISGNSGEPLLKTRGDRTRRDDPAVSGSELLGRVTHIERRGRRVQLRTRLTAAQQVICRLLRISNRATSLYLRVSAL